MKITATLLALGFYIFNFAQTSDADTVGFSATKKNVIIWADTTFAEYADRHFKEYEILYSDEYEMAMMRKSALDKTKIRLKASLEKKTLTEAEYERELNMVTDREKQIDKEMENTDLISGISILMGANFATNNGYQAYAEYRIEVTTSGKVANFERKTLIGIYDGDEVKLVER
jgi:hypothetical protein